MARLNVYIFFNQAKVTFTWNEIYTLLYILKVHVKCFLLHTAGCYIRTCILKDQEITVAKSGMLKVYCGHVDFQLKKLLFFFLGQVKMSVR